MPDDKYLLTAAEIDNLEAIQKNHFLNENAHCTNKALGDQVGLTGFGFHLMEVKPGRDSTEFHFHRREDECVYILSGRATARIGDEAFEVSAGDFLGYRKGGQPHALKNTGTEILRCLVVGQRLDTDIVEYPEQSKRMFRTAGLPWNVIDLDDIKDRPVIKNR